MLRSFLNQLNIFSFTQLYEKVKGKPIDKTKIIETHEFELMIEFFDELSKTGELEFPEQYKLFLYTMYLTGARPHEILQLKKENFYIGNNIIKVKVPTAKLKKDGKFKIIERTLLFEINKVKEDKKSIKEWVSLLEGFTSGKLFSFSKRSVERIFKGLSWLMMMYLYSKDITLTLYQLRHSRLTILARRGATIEFLKYWKGASDIRSIGPYLQAKELSYLG